MDEQHAVDMAVVAYLLLKVRQEDWHAVSDAANDIREMEAAHGSTPL